jgi:hypothetical protein
LEEEGSVQLLKSSAIRVGKLYPVLIDKNGHVIDGKHRLAAHEKWPRLVLDHIRSRRERIAVRIVSNVCRRSVSSKEKRTMLSELGKIYSGEGVKPGKIAHEIVEATGMSYRWVMKYLPDDFKARPKVGGRKTRPYSMMTNLREDPIAHHATGDNYLIQFMSSLHTKRVLEVKNYANTDFVQVIVQKGFYSRIEKLASRIGTSPETIIAKALISSVIELERRTAHNRVVEIENTVSVEQRSSD